MKYLSVAIVMSLFSFSTMAEEVDYAPIDFRVEITRKCANASATPEAGSIAAALGNIAVKGVIGFASTLLTSAAKDNIITKNGKAPGALFQSNKIKWHPNTAQCIRFWYGKINIPSLKKIPEIKADVDASLLMRWNDLGFSELPYIYAEVQIVWSEDLTQIKLEPVTYFARPSREFSGFFGSPAKYEIDIDLKQQGQTNSFAAHKIEFGESISAPVYGTNKSLNGKSSGWFTRINPPGELDSNADNRVIAGGFYTANVKFTATVPGSKIASSLIPAFESEKSSIETILKFKSDIDQEKDQSTVILIALEAVVDVEVAQGLLLANTDKNKKGELEAKLLKAKYKANSSLIQAGLSPKYTISIQ